MQTVIQLLDAAKKASGAETDSEFADVLHIKRSAVSNYRHGRAYPDTVVCGRIAELTGTPLARVLGIVGEARAVSREEKAIWHRLATAAALAVALLPLGNAQAAVNANALNMQATSPAMHIM